MCQKHIFITLAMVLCNFLQLSVATPLRPAMEGPADFPDGSAVCPEINSECERKESFNENGLWCEMCILKKGEPCTMLNSDLCADGLDCLPQDYALELSDEEMDNTQFTCQKSDVLMPVPTELTISEFNKWLALLDQVENSMEEYHDLIIEETAVQQEEVQTPEPEAKTHSSNSRRRNKHHKLNRDALPNKYYGSQTPCADHLDFVTSLPERKRNHWKPQCDSTGHYLTTVAQCSTSNRCWCVTRSGLAASDFLPKRSHRKCPDAASHQQE